MSDSLGSRLKEERGRLGVSSIDFAEQCGVSKNTQTNYEKDKRKPDANYIVAADEMGVDVFYVLKGVRNIREEQVVTKQAHNNVHSDVDNAELRVMITRINTALMAAKLDVTNDVLIDKMLPVYIKLSAEQPYNSRDAIGKVHFDDMLKLFAMQLV